MAGRWYGQDARRIEAGAVGTLGDDQLLARFLVGSDDEAEHAFEALIRRHGPLVRRVCRGILHHHAAEDDAFQAVFLVLSRRAGSIRRGESVASWLFGVAHRVATRLRRAEARRDAAHRRATAERIDQPSDPAQAPDLDPDPDHAPLHAAIGDLPERLRAPVVLFYLQGLSYTEAASQLRLTEGALRGRLARARAQLRARLATHEGGAGSTLVGLVLEGGVLPRATPVPEVLVHSTLRTALGVAAGSTAATLAQEVIRSMLIPRLKTLGTALGLALGGLLGAWHALAGPVAPVAPPRPFREAPQLPAATPPPPLKAESRYALTGTVRVDGTNEPVAGATVEVLVGDSSPDHSSQSRTGVSGPDGRYRVDVPPGSARAWVLRSVPAGFWVPQTSESVEDFAVSAPKPTHSKDYVVRRGTVWDFRVGQPDGTEPPAGDVFGFDGKTWLRGVRDATGVVHLTLPDSGAKVEAHAGSDPRSADRATFTIERDAGFQPDAIRQVERPEGTPSRFRLVDQEGRVATITAGHRGQFRAGLTAGKFLVRVELPTGEPSAVGELTGRVVATGSDTPISGARVTLVRYEGQGSAVSSDERQSVLTDAHGTYRIPAIERAQADGQPPRISVTVTRDGNAGVDTPPVAFQSPAPDQPMVLDPIHLMPGVALGGLAVGPDGQPLVGAWVEPGGSYANRARFTRTDAAGRFVVRDLPVGMVPLNFRYGNLYAQGRHLATGITEIARPVRLRPFDEVLARKPPVVPPPPKIGEPAPALDVVGWTDGKARTLADYRGQIVFLNFWGTWCGGCVTEIPALLRLKARFAPRGVVFLEIHTPDDLATVGQFLQTQKAELVSAVDRGHDESNDGRNGITADRYGIRGYPTLVLIDRQGNLAFHGGVDTKQGVARMKALGAEMGIDEATMTPDSFYRLWEAFFGREIERLLAAP